MLYYGIYNQKIAQLTNQNILLEAKLQSLTKDFELEKTLEYKTSDGGRGWIVRICSLK